MGGYAVPQLVVRDFCTSAAHEEEIVCGLLPTATPTSRVHSEDINRAGDQKNGVSTGGGPNTSFPKLRSSKNPKP